MPSLIEPLRPAYWALRRQALVARQHLRRALPWDAQKIAALDKVFILSTGRTGTLFLAQFFNRYSAHVRAFHEPYPALLELGLETAVGRTTAATAAAQLFRERRWYLQRLDRPVYLEANNRLFALAPALQLTFPGARIIHIVRDGRAVVRSGMARGWYGPQDRFPRLAAPDFPADPWAAAWAGWDMLQKGAWLWQKQNRLIRASAQELPGYYLFHFEDLFAPEGTAVRELLRLIDPQVELADDTLRAALGVKVNAGPALEQAWTAGQEEVFWRIAGAEMDFYGYGRAAS